MSNFFSINNIAVTLLGYSLSYVELFGTIFYLWSVWLMSNRRILTWPVGIVSVLLYLSLFYQIRLYSDAIEQVYCLIASVYGWWRWANQQKLSGSVVGVKFSAPVWIVVSLLITIALGGSLGAFMSRAHTVFPSIFSEDASYPYLDALTTIMSFTAMWLMARQRIESWIYWIAVDAIGIGLYYRKAVIFVSLLYVILLFMAVKGFISWFKAAESATQQPA